MRLLVIALVVVGCSKPAVQRDDVRREPVVVARDARAESIASPGVAGARSTPEGSGESIDAIVDAAPPDASLVTIVDVPMKWSAERERLTLEYRRTHSDAAATDLAIEPRVIVLHYTGGGSATGTRNYFDNPTIEAARKELARGGKVNVSSHYVIDRDGTIYRLQPETRFARHCIGLNHIAIGIENVGDEKKYPLTDAQVAANVALVRDLTARFPITHLLGHHEVMTFRAHAYYVELDDSYRNAKGDPGEAFMRKVRERVTDLALSP